MRRAFVTLVTLVTACSDSPAPATATVLADSLSEGGRYVRSVMDTMQAHSVNRKLIDWTRLRAQVLAGVPAGARTGDVYSSVKVALVLLGDHHSSYTTGGGVHYSSGMDLDCSAPTIYGVPAFGPESDVGFVRVYSFSGDSVQATAAANGIQQTIRTADSDLVRGWIVDLRGNGGGNMWPMIAGIGPILGAGTAGYFIDPDAESLPWGYDGKASLYNGEAAVVVATPHTLRLASPRVAVLIDRAVASSGEAVAVAFKQRPNTRFFGTATCGLSTAVRGYTMSDGAVLYLARAVMADRTSHSYGGTLTPDEVIAEPSAVVPRALAWLRTGVVLNQAATATRTGSFIGRTNEAQLRFVVRNRR